MKSYFTLKVPIFDIDVYVYVGEQTKKLAEKKAKSVYKTIQPIPDNSGGAVYGSIMWLASNDPQYIVHEVSHVVDGILKDIGSTDAELRAHLMDYIWYKIFTRVCKIEGKDENDGTCKDK